MLSSPIGLAAVVFATAATAPVQEVELAPASAPTQAPAAVAPTHRALPSAQALTASELYGAVKDSVVMIRTDDSLGAGFLVQNRRLIATAFHVIEDGGPLTVIARSGTEYKAKVYTYNEEQDIAVLELNRDFEDAVVLPLRTNDTPGVGEPVVMVGHPFGDFAETIDGLEGLLTWTITAGIVGAVNDRFVQTDAASSPGNSGGPIIDMHGQVLGVVSRRLENAEGLTFSVPARQLQELLDSPGQPEPLKRQPRRRFGVGLSRIATDQDLWLDGIYLAFDRSPRIMGPRWGFLLGYNTVNEVPDQSGLYNYSEDMYWAQAEAGIRAWAPLDLGSFDPFVGVRLAWVKTEMMTLVATTVDAGCDPSSSECALNVSLHDAGGRSLQAFAVGGLSWTGDIGTIGGGVLFTPFPSDGPALRWGTWAAVWF